MSAPTEMSPVSFLQVQTDQISTGLEDEEHPTLVEKIVHHIYNHQLGADIEKGVM